jgi:hypothetical protein
MGFLHMVSGSPPQVALSPHQVHIPHKDTISLAVASGNKSGYPIPSTGEQDYDVHSAIRV